jgi:hypothetical protein
MDRAGLDLSRGARYVLRQFHAAVVWDSDNITFHESPESLRRRLHSVQ